MNYLIESDYITNCSGELYTPMRNETFVENNKSEWFG